MEQEKEREYLVEVERNEEMSADEIRRLAGKLKPEEGCFVCNHEVLKPVHAALLAYAAMVERCEERIANYSREKVGGDGYDVANTERNALAELAEDIENCRIARCRSMHSYDAKTLIKAQCIVAELAKVASGHWENICDGPPAYICDAGDLKVGCCIGNCRMIAEEGAGDGK